MNSSDYVCKTCGKHHSGVPDLGFKRPDAILALHPAERARCLEFDDACEIPPSRENGKGRYFLRTVLRLPLLDGAGDPPQTHFAFGPWVEVDQRDYRALQGQKPDEYVPPFPGTIATALPGFTEVVDLQVLVVPGDVTQRPRVTVIDDSHGLGKAQREGITVHQALEFIEPYR